MRYFDSCRSNTGDFAYPDFDPYRIADEALSETVATHPQTPAITSGPPTPEDVNKLDSDDGTGEDVSSAELHQGSIKPPVDPTTLYDVEEQVTRTQNMSNKGNLVIEGETGNQAEKKDPILPVLSEPDQQAVTRTSVVTDIPIEMPTLTPEEIAETIETGNWMDALGRFPKEQRPLTIVGQVAVKEYLDAHTSIRLKPGKIDQDLKRMEKEEQEAEKETRNPRTTTTASTSEKDPRYTERKRKRVVAPPDITLRTSNGVVVPETITVCRAQVNMVGGRWLISRDGSCSMAIRASQEYRRHFVERHLGGRRPTREELPDVTADRPPDAKGHKESESITPKDQPTTEPLESPVNIAKWVPS
jgi:hypothetical protein